MKELCLWYLMKRKTSVGVKVFCGKVLLSHSNTTYQRLCIIIKEVKHN